MEPLLALQQLGVAYGRRQVLAEVSLEVRPGELWAVLGPNGAGKSTLLRAVLGLVPALAGKVEVGGKDVAIQQRAELARRVAWVPQAEETGHGFTALELVVMGRAPHLGRLGVPSADDVARASVLMKELGIWHLADRVDSAMSGGERRLVLFARALCQDTPLLLLDEPTAFLDLPHQLAVLVRARREAQAGRGIVAVLHDVNLAMAFADHVMCLREGRVLAAGRTETVVTPALLERLYGVPMIEARVDEQRVFFPRV